MWPRTKPHDSRYFGFDSFEGIPEIKGKDIGGAFAKGDYAASRSKVTEYLKRQEIDLTRVQLVEGWYEDTCTEETRTKFGLEKARVIHIDCDLYESTVTALNFITPLVQTGTIIMFDDYFHFHGDRRKGEACAFREWLERNPQIVATEFMRDLPWRNSYILTDMNDE